MKIRARNCYKVEGKKEEKKKSKEDEKIRNTVQYVREGRGDEQRREGVVCRR